MVASSMRHIAEGCDLKNDPNASHNRKKEAASLPITKVFTLWKYRQFQYVWKQHWPRFQYAKMRHDFQFRSETEDDLLGKMQFGMSYTFLPKPELLERLSRNDGQYTMRYVCKPERQGSVSYSMYWTCHSRRQFVADYRVMYERIEEHRFASVLLSVIHGMITRSSEFSPVFHHRDSASSHCTMLKKRHGIWKVPKPDVQYSLHYFLL